MKKLALMLAMVMGVLSVQSAFARPAPRPVAPRPFGHHHHHHHHGRR